MTRLRLLTVDDETIALRRLRLVLQSVPQAEHVGEASGRLEALEKVEALRPDAILLDIKMRDGTGFDVAEALSGYTNPPAVIFVTAFDQFAVRAFECAAVDYLLKPVERSRLIETLDRARRWMKLADADQRIDELQQIIRNLRSARSEGEEKPFESEFWVRNAGGLVLISADAIECVSSEDDYVAIHTSAGSYLMRTSIRQFADRVEPGFFFRIHRGWLVKKAAIAEVRGRKLGPTEVVLRSGRRLPAGRVYLKQLRRDVHLSRTPRLDDAA
jgi:two-component system LytT family response regulator